MNIDQSWIDPNTAWWAKLDRAGTHLDSLRRVVDEYRAAKPYEIVPEPTDTPGRTAYRVRIRQQVPIAVSTIVGDIVHNMRSALDSAAYEMAVRHLGRPLTEAELLATAFPICETPQIFDEFFDKRRPIRASMYGPKERAALREAQPFWFIDHANKVGVAPQRDYASYYRWDDLRRLAALSNLDKHRQLVVLAWAHALTYWPSNGETNRRWHQVAAKLTDGEILGYMTGSDPDVGDAVFQEFDLVMEDDRIDDPTDPTFSGHDVVATLEGWHRHVRWSLQKVFVVM